MSTISIEPLEAEAFAPSMQQTGDADLYFHLGMIELELKNARGALQQFGKALKIKPDHEPSLNALKSLLPKAPPSKPQNGAPLKPEAEELVPDVQDLNGSIEARSTPEPNSPAAHTL